MSSRYAGDCRHPDPGDQSITGSYPGCKLGERELAEIFEVSRIVIRQALIRLADDGLAQIERNRGAFVARPSMQEAMEIYDALTARGTGRRRPALATGWGGRLRPSCRQHVEAQRQAVASGNDGACPTFSARNFILSSSASAVNRSCTEIHAQLVRRTTLLRSLISADSTIAICWPTTSA